MNKKPLVKPKTYVRQVAKFTTFYLVIQHDKSTDKENRIALYMFLSEAVKGGRLHAFKEEKAIESYKIYSFRLGALQGEKFIQYLVDTA